ncbi:putative growth-regulating factor 3-like [Capsicum annuum]|uniref:UPF0481 protein At3g47200 n=1 Tax=Capsicum annuum TaxID=4072 RepID=UPI0007BF0308|nr:UPF0481 protein At3g47200 [Capsicum annuum]KAF3677924.1 putative growth-regulating factor 3-like [Capsicum annuum]
MSDNPIEEEHVVSINWEINKAQLEMMQQKISQPPRLLSESAGRSSCCIFRVPQSFINVHGRSYEPQIVSIGPYHRGKDNVKMIEEHKWRFLGNLLKRTEEKGLNLEDYLKAIQPYEMKARECYSEVIVFDRDEFVEMLVLDGCFIIELFRKIGGVIPIEKDDPLITMSWIYPFFLRDLIRLENQIPFFILQFLFDLTNIQQHEEYQYSSTPSLSKLALTFFNYTLQRPNEVLEKYVNLESKHLLDFLRSSYILALDDENPKHRRNNASTHVIQCISKLRRAGIKLRPSKEETFLAIRFNNNGFIEMPTITIDDFMSSFLINCVAYEQCHVDCSKHMTTYATFLDCLVNTQKDVEYLCDCNIFENYFGTDFEIATFINNLGKDVMFDIDECYLLELFIKVNGYYKSSWHVHWASFKYTYFSSPWSFISALAALVLLVLSILQTLYTILGYVHPPP